MKCLTPRFSIGAFSISEATLTLERVIRHWEMLLLLYDFLS